MGTSLRRFAVATTALGVALLGIVPCPRATAAAPERECALRSVCSSCDQAPAYCPKESAVGQATIPEREDRRGAVGTSPGVLVSFAAATHPATSSIRPAADGGAGTDPPRYLFYRALLR